jgi:hypothetical protein
MINNKAIQNAKKPFSAIKGLRNEHVLGTILIKNIYQSWNGESILQIKQKHNDNPYTMRIGTPTTDRELKNDSIYFILHYLSYNPITKDIEKRELIPYRNMEKLYIGQSIQEKEYSDYRLFVDGKAVMQDLHLTNIDQNQSITQLIVNLTNKVEKLQAEVINLRRQLNSSHIYTQGTVNNEFTI